MLGQVRDEVYKNTQYIKIDSNVALLVLWLDRECPLSPSLRECRETEHRGLGQFITRGFLLVGSGRGTVPL